MDSHGFLLRLKAARHYRGQIAAWRVFDPRPAQYREPATPLPRSLGDLLRRAGIEHLYSHQAESLDAIRAGRNVIVCTGTASGKSLCYHLPVLDCLTAERQPRAVVQSSALPSVFEQSRALRSSSDRASRALYLFPAKALAYDQLGSLERMIEQGGLAELARPACYDGDTPTHQRPGIRRTANILLSNPDMLHQSILPYHAKWAGFLAGLKFVVLDEIHSYRGIFGSHVAGVIRRLRRLCRHYGASPQFICCSATLGNPRELAQRLTGLDDMVLIDRDGSPHGRRWFVLWNPPFQDERERVARRSGNAEAQALMQALLEEGAGTITFTKARVVAELIYKYLVEILRRRRPDLVRRVRSYRGGYLPLERREIEQKLFSGELLGVCSTNALELGIDVGALDASIIVGFPGTFCSLWQQAGRAGRRQEASLCFFVAYDDPIDQYLMRNPDFLFAQPLEHAVIDPDNPHILAAQLGCAAFELPLSADDLADFGPAAAGVARVLAENGRLRLTSGTAGPGGERYYWSSAEFAAAQTSLRTISNATIAIVDVTAGRNEIIGQIDSISAPELVYPEAVYLHQGESYLVRQLDQPARLARVERLDADYYTQPVLADECRLGPRQEFPLPPGEGAGGGLAILSGECCGGRKFFGDVTVRWQTIAFRKFKLYTQELIGQTVLDLPAQQIDTTGLWLQPPEHAIAATRDAGYQVHEALAGARNLLMVALPALAMCDRHDIGGIVNASQLGVSTIILYDRYEGGVGYARHGYEFCDQLLKMAYDLVAGCPCENGCPGCVAPPNLRIPIHHDPDVGSGYAIPDKAATVMLLKTWLG